MSLWFNCILVVTVLLAPIGIALSIPTTMMPLWLTLFVFGFLLVKLLLFRTRDFLYASLLCFFYIFMILAPLLQMQNGSFPWIDYYDEDQIEMAWWITAFALLFFEFGYVLFTALAFDKKLQGTITSGDLALTTQGGLVLFFVAMVCTVIGLIFNGVDNLFLPRNEVSMLLDEKFEGNSPIQTILKSFMRVPPTVILLVFIYDIYSRALKQGSDFRLNINSLLTLILLLIVAVLNNPISTARFWVGAIVFSVLLLFLFLRDRKSAFFWFMLNLSIVVMIFPLSDVYRKHMDTPLMEALDVDPTRELVSSPDFDAFQQQVNATIVVDQHGYLYGKQFFSSMLFFVPRIVWPTKAEPTGRYIAINLDYRFDNLSTPLMAEFYIDWGLPGVIVGMMLLGIAYRYLYFGAQNRTILLTVFYCFLCAYQFYLLRGSLMTVTNYMLVALATIIIIHHFSKHIFSEQP